MGLGVVHNKQPGTVYEVQDIPMQCLLCKVMFDYTVGLLHNKMQGTPSTVISDKHTAVTER